MKLTWGQKTWTTGKPAYWWWGGAYLKGRTMKLLTKPLTWQPLSRNMRLKGAGVYSCGSSYRKWPIYMRIFQRDSLPKGIHWDPEPNTCILNSIPQSVLKKYTKWIPDSMHVMVSADYLAPAPRADALESDWHSFDTGFRFWGLPGDPHHKPDIHSSPHFLPPPRLLPVSAPWTDARYHWFVIPGQLANATLALGRRKSRCNHQILFPSMPAWHLLVMTPQLVSPSKGQRQSGEQHQVTRSSVILFLPKSALCLRKRPASSFS